MSIIVPTRDRALDLRRCLAALCKQTLPDGFEILVVDDGSRDADGVAEVVAAAPAARLLRQPPSGPAAARNAGVREARGAVICFTDDDCQPQPDWAERLVAAVGRGVDAVGGRTLSGDHKATARASEVIARAPALLRGGGELAFTPSNNLACRADVAAAMPFDERYPAAAGEDREWCARLLQAGHVLQYESGAVVVHHQRLDLVSFIRQQVRYGRGAFRFRRLGGRRRPLERPSFYAALLRRGFAEGPAAGALVCVAQVATAAGFAFEWLGRRKTGGFVR